jgi:hypothetical protein
MRGKVIRNDIVATLRSPWNDCIFGHIQDPDIHVYYKYFFLKNAYLRVEVDFSSQTLGNVRFAEYTVNQPQSQGMVREPVIWTK